MRKKRCATRVARYLLHRWYGSRTGGMAKYQHKQVSTDLSVLVPCLPIAICPQGEEGGTKSPISQFSRRPPTALTRNQHKAGWVGLLLVSLVFSVDCAVTTVPACIPHALLTAPVRQVRWPKKLFADMLKAAVSSVAGFVLHGR